MSKMNPNPRLLEQFIEQAQSTIIRKEGYWIIAVLDWQGRTGGHYIKETWEQVVSFLKRRATYIAKNRIWKAALQQRSNQGE